MEHINAARNILSKYNMKDMLNGYTPQQIDILIDTHVKPIWPQIDSYDKAKAYITAQYGAFAIMMFHEVDLVQLYSIATQLIFK
jgi:hypothetical protein